MTELKTNIGLLNGRIINISKLPYLDDVLLGNYFIGTMEVKRKSGKNDFVNVLFTFSDLKNHPMLMNNGRFLIYGSLRTHCIYTGKKRQFFQAFYPEKIKECDRQNIKTSLISEMIVRNNVIRLIGKIERKGRIRSVDSVKEKINFLLKVQENNPKYSSTIPCIAWNENSEFIDMLDEGEQVLIDGTIQSRTIKRLNYNNKKGREVKTSIINEISTIKISQMFDFNDN